MASHDINSLLISSSEFSYYDSFVDENLSMSPNGPLSHSLSGSSSYSSPLGSEVGSPETESEDEVTLAELTRRMAEFAFEDDEDSYIDGQSLKTAANSVFNQIPEAGGLYAAGYNSRSSAYNKNHGLIMNASKQPAAVLPQNLNSDNFLQMCQMRNQQQEVKKQELQCGGRRGKSATDQKHQHNNNDNNNNNNNNNIVQNRKAWKSSGHGKRGSSNSATVPLQGGGGSGIRAVFLGGSNTNRSSKGTGVFLPSAPYGKPDPKKKPAGCSTVLIPARVLQTLQQHFNNVGAKSQSQNTDVLARINGLLSQEKEQAVFKIQPPVPAPAPAPVTEQEELRLPQEWTY